MDAKDYNQIRKVQLETDAYTFDDRCLSSDLAGKSQEEKRQIGELSWGLWARPLDSPQRALFCTENEVVSKQLRVVLCMPRSATLLHPRWYIL